MSVVSYEIVDAPSNTSVWSANKGPRRTSRTRRSRFPFERGRQKRPADETFYHSGISAIGLGKTCRLGSDQKNRYLGSAVLMGPHVRSCWFDGRAHLCAAGHLRGVASDEGDRLGVDASRQVDELLNYEDSTFRSRLPSSLEVGQCSRIGENRCSNSAPDSGEHIPSNLVINGMVSESQGCGRVVCLSMRKILEKLKSLCSLSRLYVFSREGAGETASSTRDQGRALSTENVAGPRGILDSIGQDSLEDARSLGMSRADPAALPRLSSTETRRGRGQRARPLPAGSSSSSGSAVGQEMLGTPQLHSY